MGINKSKKSLPYKKRLTRRKTQTGGATVDIRKKPIIVIFAHGGCEINRVCSTKNDLYTIDKNNQLMVISHPGEEQIATIFISEILRSHWYRTTTFEPFFDLHSVSDLYKMKGIMYKYLFLKDANTDEYYTDRFTGDGQSPFESVIRANEGSKVPNSLFTFERDDYNISEKFGLYIYYPDEDTPIKYISPEELIGDFSSTNRNKMNVHLSDIFEYLKKCGIYKPDIGIGLIQFTCNSFYKDYKNHIKTYIKSGNLKKNKNIVDKCNKIEMIYHIANTEYYKLDLLDAYHLDKKYPYEIIAPVLAPNNKKESDELLEMMENI